MSLSAKEKCGWCFLAGIGSLPIVAVVSLAVFLVLVGGGAVSQLGLANLTGSKWSPGVGQFGLWPLIQGTLACTSLSLLLAIPTGLSTAIYLTLFASPRVRMIASAAVAVLGGLPSVVVGLWGMTWLVPWLGNSLAAGAIVLALMITPTFTLLVVGLLRQIPSDVIESVRALGVGDSAVARVAIRHSLAGIIAATTLAVSRALGEAVAISLVVGNVAGPPTLSGPVATLTTSLIVEFDGASGVHRQTLYTLALLVMSLILAASLAGQFAARRSWR